MAFFKEIKEKLEDAIIDLRTVEHAMIIEDDNGCVYRFQETDGDSISYVSDNPIDEEQLALFNDAFMASIEARNSITRFIIECLT
ncbi:hypothetical protein [uncultured Kordia sp.]|uniref:hypothetical protein n=1 Tax=uncultured Kordia sp. TaxID=507699 RepID=UPI00262BFF95|nr:hypothetical protein [uncultured Kordia sp.]